MAEFCPECFLKLNPEYKMSYNKFIADIKEELKKQIRKLMTEVKGEFSKDNFIGVCQEHP